MVASLSILYWEPSLHREPESKGDAIAACEVGTCLYVQVDTTVSVALVLQAADRIPCTGAEGVIFMTRKD